MALVKCPECGRERVSDTAEACPDCGYNVRAYYERVKEENEKRLEEEEKQIRRKNRHQRKKSHQRKKRHQKRKGF